MYKWVFTLVVTFCATNLNAQDCSDLVSLKVEQFYVNVSRKPDSINKVNCSLVQSRLKPGEIFIDFMQVEMNREEEFFAIIIKQQGAPDLVEIPKLKPSGMLQVAQTSQLRGGDVNNEMEAAASYKEYKNLIEYIEPYLQGASTIYYSTSDVLNFVNIKHLRTRDGKYLFQKFNMIRLHTAASFLNNQQRLVFSPKMNAMIVGNVCYECGDLEHNNEPAEYDYAWTRLPGSKKEAETISGILKTKHNVDYLDSCRATEARFTSMLNKKSYDIVHLATHGFYFTKPAARFGITKESYPMEMCGIVLSGANNKLSTAKPFNLQGMFTGMDFKSTNISNIRMIVLSTCYSGEGYTAQSAAPIGLTTALLRHGISAMMISNQAIPDEETTQLMITFYQNLNQNPDADIAFTNALRKLSAAKPNVDWSFIDIVH